MGFIQAKDVKPYVSRAGRLCIVVPFRNKNGDLDELYIEISKSVFKSLEEKVYDMIEEDEFGQYLRYK